MSDTDVFTDQQVVALTLWGEARGEGDDGMRAVGNVIQRRAAEAGWWGSTPRNVCLVPFQFSCWLHTDPNRSKLFAVAPGDPQLVDAMVLAAAALNGGLVDNTNGADSYCATGSKPAWARGVMPCAVVGKHSFYKIRK